MSPRRVGLVLGAACCWVLAACAGNPAPRGWLPGPEDAPQDPYGAWVAVLEGDESETAGELIAVRDDSVFVLTQSGRLAGFAYGDIQQARLAYYDAQWGGLAAWTILGSLATISNGYFAGITLPLWVITGSIAASAESRAPLEEARLVSQWRELRMYARFPQGMPEGLDRSVLRPRPVARSTAR